MRIRGRRFNKIGLEPSTSPPLLNVSNLLLDVRALQVVAVAFERACPCGCGVLRATEAGEQVAEMILDDRVARQRRGGACQILLRRREFPTFELRPPETVEIRGIVGI